MIFALDKFLQRVKKNTKCWIWMGVVHPGGYGQFWYKNAWMYAHRVSYILFIGNIPKNMCVLHTCDVPRCINPKHLWLGTRTDNNRDRAKKGRSFCLRGSLNGNSRLTTKQVKTIRKTYRRGNGQILAKRFGVDQSTIHYVVKKKLWGWL